MYEHIEPKNMTNIVSIIELFVYLWITQYILSCVMTTAISLACQGIWVKIYFFALCMMSSNCDDWNSGTWWTVMLNRRHSNCFLVLRTVPRVYLRPTRSTYTVMTRHQLIISSPVEICFITPRKPSPCRPNNIKWRRAWWLQLLPMPQVSWRKWAWPEAPLLSLSRSFTQSMSSRSVLLIFHKCDFGDFLHWFQIPLRDSLFRGIKYRVFTSTESLPCRPQCIATLGVWSGDRRRIESP